MWCLDLHEGDGSHCPRGRAWLVPWNPELYGCHTCHTVCLPPASWDGRLTWAIPFPEPPLLLGWASARPPLYSSFLLCSISVSALLHPWMNHGHAMWSPNLQLGICFSGTQPSSEQLQRHGNTAHTSSSWAAGSTSDSQGTQMLLCRWIPSLILIRLPSRAVWRGNCILPFSC